MKKDDDWVETYFRKKYPKENYTPTEILNFRNELVKKYGKKIIPELKKIDLSPEEELARMEYYAFSKVLREGVPEVEKWDKLELSFIRTEQKASGRLATVIFLVFRLASFIWAAFLALLLFISGTENLSFEIVILFVILAIAPFLLVILLEVFYWYIAGIIELDDIFPTYKNYIMGMLGKS